MSSRRLLVVVLVAIAFILLALGGFYLYLTGADGTTDEDVIVEDTGLVHVRTIYTYGDGVPIERPVGIGATAEGEFYVTLRDSANVLHFDPDGDYIGSWGDRGVQPGQMLTPVGVAADSLANHVYVADRARLRMIAYNTDGEFLWEIPVLSPLAPDVGPEGDLYVGTFGPIASMTAEGEFIDEVGTRGFAEGQFDFPRAIAVTEEGTVYVADTNNARVQYVEMSGDATASVIWSVGEPPRFQDDPDTAFGVPSGITLDDRGRVVVLDGFRHTIQVLDPDTGEVVHDFGERAGPIDGTFNLPTGIVHLYDDYFAITDTFNDRVQIVRLITPDEDTIFNRYPQLWWLLPLLLLLLLLPFLGRKRIFASEETLTRAVAEGNARLLLAVYKKLHVLPETAAAFADVREGDVTVGEYLVPVEPRDADTEDAEARLASAARRSAFQKLLLARHRIVCADEAQCERLIGLGAKAISFDEVLDEYSLEGDESPPDGPSPVPSPEASDVESTEDAPSGGGDDA
jgi:DNA-binding beta-propeller fold protein YncE